MTRNTPNVLTISWAGETERKLARKILNELGVYQMGISLVLCPFPCSVFVMYQLRTPPFVPSELPLDCCLLQAQMRKRSSTRSRSHLHPDQASPPLLSFRMPTVRIRWPTS